MKHEEFIKQHKELILKYDVTFCDNSDLWSAVDGFEYYKGDDFIFMITGIRYANDGQSLICGDFADYLEILKKGLKAEYES